MYRWIWKYVRKYRFSMAGGLVLVIAVAALAMVNPSIAGIVVDRVIRGGERALLPALILIMVVGTVVKGGLRLAYQMLFEHVSQNVIRRLREDLYDRVQSLDFTWFDRSRPGDVMTLMTGDLDAVRHFVAWVVYQVVENVLVFAFSVAVLSSIDVPLALCMLVVTPAIFVLALRFKSAIMPAHLAVRDQFARLNSMVAENIAGNRVVRSFVRERYEKERFLAENRAYRDATVEATEIRIAYAPLIDALTSTLPVVLIVAGGLSVISGRLTLGELVTFNGLMWALSNPLNMIAGLVNDTQRFVASAERLHELWSREPKISDAPGSAAIGEGGVGIEFRNVSLSYGESPALHDVSFSAGPGMTVGIIGPTGSGKSTIAKLMCRFYDATGGEILVNGTDIRKVSLDSLRRTVGIAMQDVFLFSDTIEGNIAFGKPEASVGEVHDAARLALADSFIGEMPEGYDTVVGERGVGLSGGQRQRIALARLLLTMPRVIILDDTTSSVDAETEDEMRKSIAAIGADRTVFVIAHRIASVVDADLVLVVEGGRITDRGTHRELSAKPGYYRDVWLHQTAGGEGN